MTSFMDDPLEGHRNSRL